MEPAICNACHHLEASADEYWHYSLVRFFLCNFLIVVNVKTVCDILFFIAQNKFTSCA